MYMNGRLWEDDSDNQTALLNNGLKMQMDILFGN